MSFGKNHSSNSGSFNGTDVTNQNTNFTTTPTNPEWVTNGAQGLYQGAQSLGGANPQSYVAGPNQLQVDAAYGSGMLNGSPQLYGQAEQTTANAFGRPAAQAQAVQASGYIPQYMSPYINDVVNASTAAFDNNAAQTRAQQQLQLAQSGAFGGSGAGIDQALTEGQLGLARGQLVSGLYNQGYDTALGASMNDANNATSTNVANAQLKQQNRQMILGAAGQLGNLAGAQNDTARQNIATQDQAGGTLQGIAQKQATAPLDLQAWLGQYFSGLPLSLFQGQSGTEAQSGTETQSGNSSGSGSGYGFGFKIPGFG